MKHLLLAAGAALALAATQTPPPAADRLTLDVVAVDRDGVPVTDLRPTEFEVWIGGYRVPIEEVAFVSPEHTGRAVVLILDNFAVNPEVAQRVREAARYFADKVTDADRMAILPLSGNRTDFTSQRASLRQAIDAYHPQGFPFRIDDAGQHVLQMLAGLSAQLPEVLPGRRRTVVAIGAGWMFDRPLPPPGSTRDLRAEWIAAMRALGAANASLYVLDPAGLGMAPIAADGGRNGFAVETGGHAFYNVNDIKGVVGRIWAESGTYYLLRTGNPPVQRNADLRESDVRVLRKGVTLRARRAIPGRR